MASRDCHVASYHVVVFLGSDEMFWILSFCLRGRSESRILELNLLVDIKSEVALPTDSENKLIC
jgi:hypothetical protein